MSGDRRFNDRLDRFMGVLTVVGAVIAIVIPLAFILAGLFVTNPHLNLIVMTCQIAGCIFMFVGFGYFICRKEI